MPARVISTTFALGAFAIAVMAGLSAGNPTRVILVNAIIAMVACNVIGLLIGAVMEHAVDEHIRAYRAAHEIPDLDTPGVARAGHAVDILDEEVEKSATG